MNANAIRIGNRGKPVSYIDPYGSHKGIMTGLKGRLSSCLHGSAEYDRKQLFMRLVECHQAGRGVAKMRHKCVPNQDIRRFLMFLRALPACGVDISKVDAYYLVGFIENLSKVGLNAQAGELEPMYLRDKEVRGYLKVLPALQANGIDIGKINAADLVSLLEGLSGVENKTQKLIAVLKGYDQMIQSTGGVALKAELVRKALKDISSEDVGGVVDALVTELKAEGAPDPKTLRKSLWNIFCVYLENIAYESYLVVYGYMLMAVAPQFSLFGLLLVTTIVTELSMLVLSACLNSRRAESGGVLQEIKDAYNKNVADTGSLHPVIDAVGMGLVVGIVWAGVPVIEAYPSIMAVLERMKMTNCTLKYAALYSYMYASSELQKDNTSTSAVLNKLESGIIQGVFRGLVKNPLVDPKSLGLGLDNISGLVRDAYDVNVTAISGAALAGARIVKEQLSAKGQKLKAA